MMKSTQKCTYFFGIFVTLMISVVVFMLKMNIVIRFLQFGLEPVIKSFAMVKGTDINNESSTDITQDLQWQMDLGLNSTNAFVFLFGSTEVQVGGCIPRECSLLFIGIHSGPDMADRRRAMRETYLKEISQDIVYRFILGHPTPLLVNENSQHHDMVFINQTERYTALDSVLPYKAASIFLMASQMLIRPTWLLKTDDDSLVNLPAVIQKLPALQEDHYYGRCLFDEYPVRDKNNKWHVSQDFWPDGKPYPPFCVGAGYFMSQLAYECAAKRIQSPSHKYLPREDVSGGVLMSKCNITAEELPGVYNMPSPPGYRPFLIQHYVKTPYDVHKLWGMLGSNSTIHNDLR